MTTTTAPAKYVPPHLRGSPATSRPSTSNASAGPSRIPYASPSFRNQSSPSRQPNAPSERESHSVLRPRRQEAYDNHDNHPNHSASAPAQTPSPSKYAHPHAQAPYPQPGTQSSPARTTDRRTDRNGYSASPSLYIYGDSFTGPFKLLSEEGGVRITTFKGASAKGLNNPNSIKQVSKDLLPALNGIMAPPPYAYTPSAGRWALLIFGNVDLQVNYLWQLQHKPISALSFPTIAPQSESTESNDLPLASDANVLASATETTLRGPALGPDLFVENVVRAYTTWLEREIVNGPIGQAIREKQDEQSSSIRKKKLGKLLIASALPPLVEDDILPRIPEKYVERLEEEHTKTQKALEREERLQAEEDIARESRTPWAMTRSTSNDGLSSKATEATDVPPTPSSSSSSSSRTDNSDPLIETLSVNSSLTTSLTEPPSPSRPEAKSASQPNPIRKSIESLLQHDPPLCTLSTRIYMTNKFNELLQQFCEKHPDILGFVDITPAIMTASALSNPSLPGGQADRGVWACPVDATNIHPTWEVTLPLWLEELKGQGVPTGGYFISTDAEETFRAYEEDKRRRTANGPYGGVSRIKLRDE